MVILFNTIAFIESKLIFKRTKYILRWIVVMRIIFVIQVYPLKYESDTRKIGLGYKNIS